MATRKKATVQAVQQVPDVSDKYSTLDAAVSSSGGEVTWRHFRCRPNEVFHGEWMTLGAARILGHSFARREVIAMGQEVLPAV